MEPHTTPNSRPHARRWTTTAALLAVLGLTGPFATAQVPEPEEAGAPPASQADVPPASTDASPDVPSAPTSDETDRVPRDLLGRRRTPPVVEPQRDAETEPIPSRVGVPATRVDIDASVLGLAPDDNPPPLRREGEFIVRQRGRLVQPDESPYTLIIFEPADASAAGAGEQAGAALPPMVLQPSRDLETMQQIAGERDGEVMFVVSGQVHTYRGMNYLLPTMAAPPRDIPAQAAADAAADASAGGANGAASETDEVLARLLRQRQAPRTMTATTPAAGAANTPDAPHDAVRGRAPGQAAPKLLNEGTFIVDRRGRLVRSNDGAHVLFAFEADGRDSPEPPLIVQASQLRESMENTVQLRGDRVVFIVSGQVFTYRGANYLLPTMMKIARQQDNLDL